jgi:peptidoglycan/LPS O-acetylase OafA/YrhL
MWGGVDLFFCISGFVIARSLILQVGIERSAVNFLRFAIPFWIKRVFRIWPVAFLWIAISLLFSAFFNKYGSYGELGKSLNDAKAAFLQVANLHYLWCLKCESSSCTNLLGVYWSLSLEEQFYTIFPVALFFVPRKYFVPALIVMVLLQVGLYRPTWSPFWPVRCDALMLGVLIAYAQSGTAVKIAEPAFLAKAAPSLIFFTIGVFILGMLPADRSLITLNLVDRPFVWFNTGLIAIISAVLVFVASFDRGYTFPEGRLKDLMVYVGTRRPIP